MMLPQLLLLVALIAGSNAQSLSPETCSFGSIDFSSLASAGNTAVGDFSASGPDGNTYFINPCGVNRQPQCFSYDQIQLGNLPGAPSLCACSATLGGLCSPFANPNFGGTIIVADRAPADSTDPIDTPAWSFINGAQANGVQYRLTNGQRCPANADLFITTVVQFVCTNEADPFLESISISGCTYTAVVRTPLTCVAAPPVSSSTAPALPSSSSVGVTSSPLSSTAPSSSSSSSSSIPSSSSSIPSSSSSIPSSSSSSIPATSSPVPPTSSPVPSSSSSSSSSSIPSSSSSFPSSSSSSSSSSVPSSSSSVASSSSSSSSSPLIPISSSSSTIYIIGDPQFVGLRGQSYQVHGIDGEFYNLVSSSTTQINSKFVFLNEGSCPIIDGIAQPNCWSHPGSYVGEIGVQQIVGDHTNKLHVVSGPGESGFASVIINGREMQVGEELSDSDAFYVSFETEYRVRCRTVEFEFVFDNSDMFLNQGVAMRIPIEKITAHGLIGQTHQSKIYPTAVKYIVGDVDDYVIDERNIWGSDFVYNRFNPQ